MSHEILYTSAPRLLKPGMTGYGTVVSTRGISSPLADKLEALSGYRWAFEQGDPQARLNPVCHSHVVITVAGQKYHVLSRVADYGADYSGRSNKIAHHVALTESELTPGGPGWVLKAPGFCETRWDEQLKNIEAGRQPTRSVRDSADYSVWKRVMGDAGWAGVLAETVSTADRRAVHIIFPLGTDTLGLVEESLNLLPHRERWGVSFSTYFNTLPASVDCQWRFVLDGTPEATNLRRQPHQRIIDLCRPSGPPLGGELVQRARSGWQPTLGAAPPPPVSAVADRQSPSAGVPSRREVPASPAHRVDADVLDPSSLAFSPPVPSRYATNAGNHPRESSGWRLPLWGTLLLCLLFGTVTGGVGFWIGQQSTKPTDAMNSQEAAPAPNKPNKGNQPAQREMTAENPPTEDQNLVDAPDDVVKPATLPETGLSASSNHQGEGNPNPAAQPDADINKQETHAEYIQLPDHSSSSNVEKEFTQDVKIFQPEVFGDNVLLGNDMHFILEKKDLTWVLRGEGEKPLATFRAEDSKWIFQWDRTAALRDVSILPRCLIRLGKDETPILMSKPFVIEAGCLLPDTQASQVDLCPTDAPELAGLEQCLSKMSLGGWKLNNLPSDYEIIDIESPLSLATKPGSVVLKILKDKIGIAELKIELQHQDNKEERPLSIVELNLMALIPPAGGKNSTKLWLKNVRNSDTERFSLAKNKKDREAIYGPEGPDGSEGNGGPRGEAEKWIAFGRKAWSMDGKITDEGKRVAEEYKAKKITNPSLSDKDLESLPTDKDGNMDSKGMQALQEIIQKKELYVQERNTVLSDLNNLKDWRVRMNALTDLLDKQVVLSFEIFYKCDVDGAPRKVILGTVTTKLPDHTASSAPLRK